MSEAFKDDIPKSKYVRQTERALYEYNALKVAIENERELFPSLVPAYEESTKGSSISKPTELWGLRRAEKREKLEQINRAIAILSKEERELVEIKYLNNHQPGDTWTAQEMRLSPATYYRLKDRTIRKIATALNII